MRSRTNKQFRDLLESLPESVQRQAQDAYRLLCENPFHPGLNFKSVGQRDPNHWSVRVGIHYRAIGIRDGDDILWTWIDSPAEYDRERKRS